jgi:hypothetical protein
VSARLLRRSVGLAALVFAVACTSALKEPPPISEIGQPQAKMAVADPADPGHAVALAELEFDRRPDPAAVQRSQTLYLEASRVDGAPVEAFLGAARATAWLVEHEENAPRREELAVEGVQIGQHCTRLFPEVPECQYRLALAVGQQARERPSTAVDGLEVMVELLTEVIAVAPNLDFAGGDRVLALVLLRAPGWPTGPGDIEKALAHAVTAAERYPRYPPNQLVLAEALDRNDQPEMAGRAFQKAADLARDSGFADDPDAVEWLVEAETALSELQ